METLTQVSQDNSNALNFYGYDRIRAHTPDHVNQKIQSETDARIRRYLEASSETVSKRLQELDREWDIDRAAMIVFASLGSLASILGAAKNRKWLMLHAIQFPFIVYHAAVGWCPPVSVLRRLGFRSAREIELERCALLSLSGTSKVA